MPAYFLHSVGNFQFYDPVSRSCSRATSAPRWWTPAYAPASDFDAHVPLMSGFQRRYMASNRACRWWARRARRLDIDVIVPQHGLPIAGAARFTDWVEQLVCGVDLLAEGQAITF